MFKRILIPIDGSPHAERAIELGCELAKRFDSRFVFLHVLMRSAKADDLAHMQGVDDDLREKIRQSITLPMASVMGAAPITVIPPDVLADVGEHILEHAKERASAAGLPGSILKIKDGDPGKAIVETAAEEEADVIVMGRRGLGMLESLLQGSTSERVSRLAECTCITVH
jgi:nucleotide-binding universal stress UspA family protein